MLEVRKIFKAGNSLVISLPMNLLKALDLKDGSHVSVEISREKKELILKPIIVKKSNMSIEFVRTVDKLLVDYDYTIRGLANK